MFVFKHLLAASAVTLGLTVPLFAQMAGGPAGAAETVVAHTESKATYVLVHGAWAGGWEWKKMGQLLTADGYTVYRPTLTGQGERVHLATPETDVNTHITDVVNTILFEDLHDIVLVGHSYGGMVVTGVADRVPDRIKALIYVDAFVPVDGESANDGVGRRGPTPAAFLTPAGWPYPADRKPPYIVPMPAKTFSTPVALKNPARMNVPTAYILTVDAGKQPEQDMFFKSYQRANAYGWATEIMKGDHVVHINQPAELLKRLEHAPLVAKPAQASPASQP